MSPAWRRTAFPRAARSLATLFEPSDPKGCGAPPAGRDACSFRSRTCQGGFGGLNERQARAAYDESLVAANLSARPSRTNMSLLLEALGAGEDMAAALRSFGVTYADFERDVAVASRLSR